MKTVSARALVLIVLTLCCLLSTTAFAQSTGTFTVTKYFSDSNPNATVSISLDCGPGTTTVTNSPQNAGHGDSVYFDLTNVQSGDDCSATESGAPTGYSSDDTINCYQIQLTEDDPDYFIGSCNINNDAWCGDGQIAAYSEQCDDGNQTDGDCCSSSCQFESDATICNASVDFCDAAEYCTGTSATCPADVLAVAGTECRVSADVCDAAEVCTGTSAACPGDVLQPADYTCRGAADVCDAAELCTGTSVLCPADVLQPAHTECRGVDPAGDECDVAEVCSGTSTECPADGFAAEGTLCGDVPDFACDPQDVCTGTADECVPNPDPLAACGVIGKGDACELNICDPEGPADFRLLFTPDLPNWVSYKLNASNPGQLFYTLISEPDVPDDANLLLQVPFPFVTQGGMTLHVYDAADVWTEESCVLIGEGAESTPYDVEITMDSYWGAGPTCTEPTSIDFPTEPGAYCKHITGPNPEDFTIECPSEYDPNGGSIAPALALQECWAYVPVEIENEGQFAARLHLDYGLKGKWLDEYCPDEVVDRYAPAGKGVYGDFNANGIDVGYSSTENQWLTECNIPTCQPYTFAQGVESEQESNCYSANGGTGCDNDACEETVCLADDWCCNESWDSLCADIAVAECDADLVGPVEPAESVVQSVNYFKKPVGIFGRAYCDNGDDDPTPPLLGDGFAGLTAKLYKAGSGTLLAQATTDADGYYFLNYKHKGKAVYYNVELWNGGTFLKETSGNNPTPPGNVPLQANGFAEQNFYDSNTCSAASGSGWMFGNWEITKGKFKTIVP